MSKDTPSSPTKVFTYLKPELARFVARQAESERRSKRDIIETALVFYQRSLKKEAIKKGYSAMALDQAAGLKPDDELTIDWNHLL